MWRPNRSAGGPRTIEDWEHGAEPEDAGWGGVGTADFDNQADGSLEGAQNVVNNSSGATMSTSSEETAQGNEYRMRIYFPASTGGSFIYFAIHAQTNDSGGSTNHSYQVLANHGAGSFSVYETEPSGGSRTQVGGTTSFAFADDTAYQVGIRHRDDGDLEAFIYDDSGNEQASIGPATPTNQFGPGSIWMYHDAVDTISDDIREYA